jgi:hypothetical protein
MRIEGYGTNPAPLGPTQRKPATTPKPVADPAPVAASDAAELTPKERLRQLLEQKRWMAEAAFADGGPEPELGKHIDLRV